MKRSDSEGHGGSRADRTASLRPRNTLGRWFGEPSLMRPGSVRVRRGLVAVNLVLVSLLCYAGLRSVEGASHAVDLAEVPAPVAAKAPSAPFAAGDAVAEVTEASVYADLIEAGIRSGVVLDQVVFSVREAKGQLPAATRLQIQWSGDYVAARRMLAAFLEQTPRAALEEFSAKRLALEPSVQMKAVISVRLTSPGDRVQHRP